MQPGCCAFTIGQGGDKSEEWPVLIFLMQIGALINEHRRTAINSDISYADWCINQ